jgi:hypothetical protein
MQSIDAGLYCPSCAKEFDLASAKKDLNGCITIFKDDYLNMGEDEVRTWKELILDSRKTIERLENG